MLPDAPPTARPPIGPSRPIPPRTLHHRRDPRPDLPLVDPRSTPGAAGEPGRRGWPFAVAIVLVAVLGGSALFMSGYRRRARPASRRAARSPRPAAWQPLWDVYDAVTTRYPLGPVDRTTLIEGAIRGMVEAVGDPYSTYLSPDDFRSTLNDISGQFEGIGAEIGAVDAAGNTSDCATFGPNCHLVDRRADRGLAGRGGRPDGGRHHHEVDGVSLDWADAGPGARQGPRAAGHAGRAQRSSRGHARRRFDVTITRAARPVLQGGHHRRTSPNGTVGYIRLTGFSDEGRPRRQGRSRPHLDKGITKIVLDLRGNPGGFVTDARTSPATSSPRARSSGARTRTASRPRPTRRGGGVATDPKIQVVVLIDKGSASASEIVAGALQDRERAKLIGETSFGKGTVQEWIELGDLGGVKLTVEKWLTPNKRWIHQIGLDAGRPGDGPGEHAARQRPGPRQGARGPRRIGAPRPGGLLMGRPAVPRVTCRPRVPFRYGSRERKEVMCSVRTRSLHHLAGDDRLTGHPLRVVSRN